MSNHDIGGFFDELECDVESHPQIDGGLLDFLATTPDRESFYVESTV